MNEHGTFLVQKERSTFPNFIQNCQNYVIFSNLSNSTNTCGTCKVLIREWMFSLKHNAARIGRSNYIG